MKSHKHEKLIRTVALALRKKSVRFKDVANDLNEDKRDISANYLWKVANYNQPGGIRRPGIDKLLIIAKHLGVEGYQNEG